jgi:hypothetical protein
VTPPSSIVRVGAPLTLTCNISTTQRNSTFSWTVNGDNVDQLSSERYVVQTVPPDRSILNITRLDSSDIGQIRCTGQDPIHVQVFDEASVAETSDLYIVGQLGGGAPNQVNSVVEIETNLVLNCTVRNAPAGVIPSISWFFRHRQLENGTRLNIGIYGTLTKYNVSVSDEDAYLCSVRVGDAPLELTVNVEVTSKL